MTHENISADALPYPSMDKIDDYVIGDWREGFCGTLSQAIAQSQQIVRDAAQRKKCIAAPVFVIKADGSEVLQHLETSMKVYASASEMNGKKRVDDHMIDLTAPVLALTGAQIRSLDQKTNPGVSELLDQLALPVMGVQSAHVDYDSLVDALMDFIGTNDINGVTDSIWQQLQESQKHHALEQRTIYLTMRMDLSVVPGTNLESVAKELSYTVASKTPGAFIEETQITAVDVGMDSPTEEGAQE